MSQFNLFLPSNASHEYFPNNITANYKTKLASVLELGNEYECALTEISFTKSWLNVPNDLQFGIEIDGTVQVNKYSVVKAGFYTLDSLVKTLNGGFDHFDEFKNLAQGKVKPFFKVHSERKSIVVKSGNTNNQKTAYVYLCKPLLDILGISMQEVLNGPDVTRFISREPIGLDEEFTHLYIYADFIGESFIGDASARLLRIVPVPPSLKFGDTHTQFISTPIYQRVSKSALDVVEVHVQNDIGHTLDFTFGRVVLSLHFRKNGVKYLQ